MNSKSKEPEYVKQYNNSYYARNKEKILNKETGILRKVNCDFCNREIAYQQVNKHQKTKYCMKNRNDNIYIKNELKKMLENDKLKESAQTLLNLMDDQ